MRYNITKIGEWTFYEIHNHGFKDELEGRPLYAFIAGDVEYNSSGSPKWGWLYSTLDHAMVAAVGEKYTGQRGAGGTGVDTAAGWFMRMIGADLCPPGSN